MRAPTWGCSTLAHVSTELRVADPATDVDKDRPLPRTQRSVSPATAILCLAMVAALNVAWFAPFPGRTLMGDDLELLIEARTGGYASDVVRSFSQVGFGKFRPVVTFILAILTDAFGTDFTAYRMVNLGVQTLNVFLVGLLAWRLSRRSWPVTLGAAVAVTVSRFNMYFALQVYGVMEGLALTFILTMLLAVVSAYASQNRRMLSAASLCFFLALFTHERYIVLAPFLVAATLLIPGTFTKRRDRLVLAAVPLAVAAFNIGVKTWLLKINYFTGAAGQDVAFAPGQTMTFMLRGLLNLVGFNTGPDYLSGKNMHSLGALGVVLGMLFLAPVSVLLIATVWRDTPDILRRVVVWRKYLLAGLLIVPLLISASISFRQEYRWLYSPFVVLVLGISWMLGRMPRGQLLRGLTIAAVFLAAIGVDGYYRTHAENMYIFGQLKTADSLRKEIVERHSAQLDSATVFLVTHDSATLTDPKVRGGAFFDYYAPGRKRDIRFVPSLEEAVAATGVRPTLLAFDYRGDSVVDVTGDLLRLEGTPPSAPAR